MEMVKTRLVAAIPALLLLVSCQPRFTWERVLLDGSRTGVQSVTGENITEALGYVDSVYHAPNGRIFTDGATPKVASSMIGFQPGLQHLKEVIGFCPEGMARKTGGSDSALNQWVADALLIAGESLYHNHVDVSIVNKGGIRVDMPKGEVMLGEILAMFPFRNNIVSVELRGDDLKDLFEFIAESGKFSFGGARIEVRDRILEKLEIGGLPLDENRIYNLVTIDFLLSGGDGMNAGEKALSVRNNRTMMSDWMVPFIKTAYSGGAVIEQINDGRYKEL